MDGQLAIDFDAYTVRERDSRSARSIRIEVRPGGEVVLVIPRWASRKEAYAFLRDRDPWVRRKVAEWRLRSPHATQPRLVLRWDDTDLFPLRGDDVPLRVASADVPQPRVRFDDGITVFAPAALCAEPARLERCLKRALVEEARRAGQRLLQEEGERVGLRCSGLRIGDTRSQWGSCGANGRISLSWRLLLAPAEVFRYVAIHELCHLRWRGHGPRFWGLVRQQMPHYEDPRAWLREQGSTLHAVLARPTKAPAGGDIRPL